MHDLIIKLWLLTVYMKAKKTIRKVKKYQPLRKLSSKRLK